VKNEVSSINIVDEIEARRQQILGKTKLAAKEGIVIAPSLDDFRRVLAVGDIHGFYEPLRALFSAVDYVPEKDLLIFLGDGEGLPGCCVKNGGYEAFLFTVFHIVVQKSADI